MTVSKRGQAGAALVASDLVPVTVCFSSHDSPAIVRDLATGPSRERDVLILVAQGRSNQEIANELVISERTARTHVSNVLRKLQLTSRTQAALVAVRQGLLPPQN